MQTSAGAARAVVVDQVGLVDGHSGYQNVDRIRISYAVNQLQIKSMHTWKI